VDIAGQTDSLLAVPSCLPELSGTVYSVRVWNQGCATSASAKLIVSSRPRLAITELMSLTSFGHAEWFELTNYGTNEFDLLGYRFYDREPSNGLYYASLGGSSEVVTIPRSLLIRPGESVIFLHHLSADDFIRWWGHKNLPPGLQIFTYAGFALSICGETLFLWNAAAVQTGDCVATAAWLKVDRLASWEFENTFYESDGYRASWPSYSALEINGAWAAPAGGDIGSPGLTEVTPPHFLDISSDSSGITVTCRGHADKRYRLSRKTCLTDDQWVPVTEQTATDALPFLLRDPTALDNPMRFYRLEELP
jgi:hypothetical protein